MTRGITLGKFILQVTIIEAEAIMSVYKPTLKNTNQDWWTFQNSKLWAWEQIIFKKKVKSDVNLNKHTVYMKTVHGKPDEWSLICTRATIL